MSAFERGGVGDRVAGDAQVGGEGAGGGQPAGESVERIIQLGAWQESRHFYTEKELAALEQTDAVTVLTDGFVPDEVHETAAKQFEEAEPAQPIAAITVINAWNRFGVTCRMVPGHYTPGDHG